LFPDEDSVGFADFHVFDPVVAEACLRRPARRGTKVRCNCFVIWEKE
jgi:hypothetical protein